MNLDGRRVVVTGGATGIGRATAMHCASMGASVVVADVNEADGADCVARICEMGGEAWFVRTDVSVESEVRGLMAEAVRRMGGVDGLVTAAGIARDSMVPVEDVPEQVWDDTIDVNLKGSFLAAKHAVPAIRLAGGGVIVMIASGAGVTGGSSTVSYGASKGGVNGLGMTLEAKLRGEGIRVNVLCPGEIATPLKLGIIEQQARVAGEDVRLRKENTDLGEPEGVARVIGFLLSDDAAYVRGSVFTR